MFECHLETLGGGGGVLVEGWTDLHILSIIWSAEGQFSTRISGKENFGGEVCLSGRWQMFAPAKFRGSGSAFLAMMHRTWRWKWLATQLLQTLQSIILWLHQEAVSDAGSFVHHFISKSC